MILVYSLCTAWKEVETTVDSVKFFIKYSLKIDSYLLVSMYPVNGFAFALLV